MSARTLHLQSPGQAHFFQHDDLTSMRMKKFAFIPVTQPHLGGGKAGTDVFPGASMDKAKSV